MSRSPNSEQLLAIEHSGGVLLRAGAGSGKTFVLVHHILHLTNSWIDDYLKSYRGDFEDFIRMKFSQIVMMTFTKKAAGEMSIRLSEKFEEKANEPSAHQKLWVIVNEALPLLTVTTIDGFCRKLITQGFFPHLSSESKIIFSTERSNQIREILDEWLKTRADFTPKDLQELIIREKRSLLFALSQIFTDPGLRLTWKSFDLTHVGISRLDKLLYDSFHLNDLESALVHIQELEIDEEKNRSAFEKIIANFQSTGLPVVDSVDKLAIYAKIFNGIKVLSGERTARKKSPASELAKTGLLQLKAWVKEWAYVIESYQENFDRTIIPWVKICLEIFHFIDHRLDPNQGMTFGDIEYFVANGLEDTSLSERIQKNFNYFIVDEFQDTSNIQFDIIRRLIGDDFSRLFCVGDSKQAIYGFRGGELSVFQNCAEHIPTVMNLKNNYRSTENIIEFNNSLFRMILPLGHNFEGHDPFSVHPEDQKFPNDITSPPDKSVEISRMSLVWDEANDEKLSTGDVNYIEAMLIADSIQKERNTTSNVCTVLYSKLRPCGELIKALMQRNIGFTAQYKIDFLDDPLLGIFVVLLKSHFDLKPESKYHYPLFMIQNYLNILEIDVQVSEKNLKAFEQDIIFWGLSEAFHRFIFSLNITNENLDLNFDTIELISDLYLQDSELVMGQLLKTDNERLSLELRSGDNPSMVQIMSAHASKGLEFDVVYLGGIYTNGKDRFDGSLFGKLPGSFQWYPDSGQREKQKSPFYIYENELSKYKNFSEAKRLFYVACTRAKKKIVWIDLQISDKAFAIPQNSWIIALRHWENNCGMVEKIKVTERPDMKAVDVFKGDKLPQLPLFFFDPVGIFPKKWGDSSLIITGELSVTKLNYLVDCPRKFYLSNVLKINPDQNFKKTYLPDEDTDDIANVIRSSTDRGILIHSKISEGINRNFIIPRSVVQTEFERPVQWVLSEIKKLENSYDFISEREMKFELFNYTVTGIPDLVLEPKGNHTTQIWDFKTGQISDNKLAHYWTQLVAYAYGLFQLGHCEQSDKIELVLSFVDQEKNLTKNINYNQTVEWLYPLWISQSSPSEINTKHCSHCFYGSICPR